MPNAVTVRIRRSDQTEIKLVVTLRTATVTDGSEMVPLHDKNDRLPFTRRIVLLGRHRWFPFVLWLGLRPLPRGASP